MNYDRMLYETAAYLVMLQAQMREYPFSTVVSCYISEARTAWEDPKLRGVESAAILLILERLGEDMPEDIISLLEQNISEVGAEMFPENDRAAVIDDLKTAKGVVQWYRGR